jgi:hypothetical protein
MSSILNRRQPRKRRRLDCLKLESFKNSVSSAISYSTNHSSTLTDFLEGFPSVRREQVIAVLEASRKELLQPA